MGTIAKIRCIALRFNFKIRSYKVVESSEMAMESDPQPSLMDSQLDDDSSGEGWGSDHGVWEEGAWSKVGVRFFSRCQKSAKIGRKGSMKQSTMI